MDAVTFLLLAAFIGSLLLVAMKLSSAVTVVADESGAILRTSVACLLELLASAAILVVLAISYHAFLGDARFWGQAHPVRTAAYALLIVWVSSVPLVAILLGRKLEGTRSVLVGFTVLVTLVGLYALLSFMALGAACNGISLIPGQGAVGC
jgi:hypothetical protein